MINPSPSDREEDYLALRRAAMVIGGIAAVLVIAIVLVVFYAHGYPI
jgi:hypothetical protein